MYSAGLPDYPPKRNPALQILYVGYRTIPITQAIVLERSENAGHNTQWRSKITFSMPQQTINTMNETNTFLDLQEVNGVASTQTT
jgi:hypothetical protein